MYMYIDWLDHDTFHADTDYLHTHLFLQMKKKIVYVKNKIKIKINLY